MAILDTLDRLVRTELPARCTDVGLTSDATLIASRPRLDRATRVAQAVTAVRDLEDRIVAAWNPAWDPSWSPRTFRALLVTSGEITEAQPGSNDERLLFKAALRVCEYLMCRKAAVG